MEQHVYLCTVVSVSVIKLFYVVNIDMDFTSSLVLNVLFL